MLESVPTSACKVLNLLSINFQLLLPILPAVFLALLLSKKSPNQAVEQFLRGAGHQDIMTMCMIYLLAGGFAAVAKASGDGRDRKPWLNATA